MGRLIAASLDRGLVQYAAPGPTLLQLVGRREETAPGVLIGLCGEFRDAYAETCPDLEVVLDLDAVRADLLIICSGAALSKQFQNQQEIARANLEVFDKQVAQLAPVNSESMVPVVSNPVGIAMRAFVDAGFHKNRILGSGSFLH